MQCLLALLCTLPACSSPPWRHPLPAQSPHLYFYKTSEVAHAVRRTYPALHDGFIFCDPTYTSLIFQEFDYVSPRKAFACTEGAVKEIPVVQLPQDISAHAKPLADPNEWILGADDASTLFFTYINASHLVRIRPRENPSHVLFEMHSELPPQKLLAIPGRLYLVTGEPSRSSLGPPDILQKHDTPLHIFILIRSFAAITLEREVPVPAAQILTADPWSTQILAEDHVWAGWTPLFYGQNLWQIRRFTFDLATKERTDIPAASGVLNLPEGFFLQSDPFAKTPD